jgi:hypothetical protein
VPGATKPSWQAAVVSGGDERNVLEVIDGHLRHDETLDPNADLVVREWPLTVDGLLLNADATRCRFSYRGDPLVAISAEVTVAGWTLEGILAGPRLRTRSRFARAEASALLSEGFELLATFGVPHYSVLLPSYDVETAQRLLDVLGDVQRNPFYVGRQS